MKPDLLLQNADFVQCLAHSLVTNTNCADDVMQETWIAALKRSPGDHYVKPWLTRVVKNISIKFLRSETRRSRHEREAARIYATSKNRATSPAEQYDRKIIRSQLMKAVMDLKAPYRQAIMLRYFDNLPPREIADFLDMPVERVKAHLKRGLAQLRAKLDQTYKGDRKRWVLALLPFTGLAGLTEAQAAELGIRNASMSIAGNAGVPGMAPAFKALIAASVLLCLTIPLFLVLSKGFSHPAPLQTGSLISADYREASDDPDADQAGLASMNEKVPLQPGVSGMKFSGTIVARQGEEVLNDASIRVTPLPDRSAFLTKMLPDGKLLDRNILDTESHAFRCDASETGDFSMLLPLGRREDVSALLFTISHPGYRDLERVIHLTKSKDEYDCGNFFLDMDRSYTLLISNPDETPVPNARLECFKGIENHLVVEKRSDAQGLITITDRELGRISGRIESEHLRLRIMAPEKAPSYYNADMLGAKVGAPLKIVMEPAGFFMGQVVDDETGYPLHEAEVLLFAASYWDSMIEPVRAETDAAGNFRIPRFSYSSGVPFELHVNAKGYFPQALRTFEDYSYRGSLFQGFDNPIRMHKADLIKKTKLIDAATKKPLANVVVFLFLYDTLETHVRTDKAGIFLCPFFEERRARLTFNVDGYEPYHYCYRCCNDIPVPAGDVWTVALKPKAGPFTVRVIDASGHPLKEAVVTVLNAEGTAPLGGSFTDRDGHASIVFERCSEACMRIKVEHPEYAPLFSEVVNGHLSRNEPYELVLEERAHLLQNIQVIDESGHPMPGMLLRAFMFDEDNRRIWRDIPHLYYGPTDENGFCDIVFPSFKVCLLHAMERVTDVEYVERIDSRVRLSFDDVLEQAKVVLELKPEIFDGYTIEGTVRDHFGHPLSGIVVHAKESCTDQVDTNGKSDPKIYSIATRDDGSFTLVVPRDKRYDLNLPIQEIMGTDGRFTWHGAEPLLDVPTGSRPDITMESWSNRVFVSLEGEGASVDDPIWLEDENGTRIEADEIVCQQSPPHLDGPPMSSVTFFGVPCGKLGVVYLAGGTDRHESSLFTVKARDEHHTRIVLKND